MNATQLMIEANLDWPVAKQQLFAASDSLVFTKAANRFGVVKTPARADHGPATVLGLVSDRYQLFSNLELAALVDAMVSEGRCGQPVGVHSLKGGRVVMVQCAGPQFSLGTGERHREFTLFGLSHDTSLPVFILPGAERYVCSNQLQTGNAVKVLHTSGLAKRLESARDALATLSTGSTMARLGALSTKAIDWYDALSILDSVYTTLVSPGNDDRNKRIEWTSARTARMVLEQTQYGCALTRYLAFNACTQWSDNDRRFRATDGESDSSARMHSVLFGASADFKRKALALVESYDA